MSEQLPIRLTVNGAELSAEVEPRLLLSDFIRHRAGLTGTHVGCEHGVCGACTVLVDGEPQRSCLVFAVQADGAEVETVEGLAAPGAELHALQQAFHEEHGMQCGFCTSGFLMTSAALLREHPHPSDAQLLDAISGNLCRCTGYQNIIRAVRSAEAKLAAQAGDGTPAAAPAGDADGA
ncbi:(2Fe-2S)-binding protein [Conexibacter sp. JD483]|uniref:(2Fe-2S)-binding protein n=1 Tax=unclassified Conexibacter TaxID=2627773 RepID=UPI00271ACA97|nr:MULTISPECIES: (2Fe-2S)-binding protein [unclassified Conexibacter]MDO8189305.1 (2Fe-2S)-binding protein [Conexibacter sp. CPCC 205706]MDO8201987.1 (2Fe-2S)-binding protein [Conexibacter sp. CPCC 205762]MDR9372296.1 (2Fe-2S)-binding protein [Conexibacter sp. JD483]